MPYTLKEIREMSQSANIEVRKRARYADICPEVLKHVENLLLEDRMTLSLHKTLPEYALFSLAKDPEVDIRRVVSQKRQLTAKICELLIDDEDEIVRSTILKNPMCPDYLLERASQDDNPWIRGIAQEVKNKRVAARSVQKPGTEHDD